MSVTEASRRIPRPHHNYVPEYQMSGIPHVETRTIPTVNDGGAVTVSADDCKFEFDSVTRWIIIHNHSHAGANNDGNHIRVYFSKAEFDKAADLRVVDGVNQDTSKHYFVIDHDETSLRLELKCKEVYIRPEKHDNDGYRVCIVAGLTNVSAEDFPDQTRNNGFTGIEQE